MKTLLLAALFASLACAQGTKLAHPIIALPPAAGGVSTFTPKSDLGGNLGSDALRWNLLESKTGIFRVLASGAQKVTITGIGVFGTSAASNPTFSLSSSVGTADFSGAIAIHDGGNIGGNFVALVVPGGIASSIAITLPSTLPGSTQFVTVTAGGFMGYSSVFPACGSNTQIAYNNASVCAGDAELTWDNSSKILRATNVFAQQIQFRSGAFPFSHFQMGMDSSGNLAISDGVLPVFVTQLSGGGGMRFDEDIFPTASNARTVGRSGNVWLEAWVKTYKGTDATLAGTFSAVSGARHIDFTAFSLDAYNNSGVDVASIVPSASGGTVAVTDAAGSVVSTMSFSGFSASTATGTPLQITSSNPFGIAATIDNTGGGSALALGANCAGCIAFSMTNANAAGVQLQFGPGGAGGIFSVNYYVNNGAPAFGCNNGDVYHRKDGGVGTTFYGCRGGAWAAWF